MAKRQRLPHPVSATWSAGGSFAIDLSNKPSTITGMYLIHRSNITSTATPATYNDPWDRQIANLTLSGSGHQYFNFTDLRLPYYHQREFLGINSPKRASLAASLTTTNFQTLTYIHFGTAPTVTDAASGKVRQNPYDLTAGIAPSTGGNLQLTGTFGPALFGGGAVTQNSGQLDIVLDMVLPEAGDAPEAYLPRAVPAWQMTTPSLTATTGSFQQSENVPVGSFLHSVSWMTTSGANAPRSDAPLNSIRLQDVLGGNTVVQYGQGSAAAADYLVAPLISQLGAAFPLADDPAAAGVLTAGTYSDPGLAHVDMTAFAVRGDPLFGLDLRRVGTGAVSLQYGVANATTTTLAIFYRRYDLNLAHPANAGR